MRLRPVRPGDAWLTGRRAFVHLMAEAAERLGGRLELEEAFGHVGRYHPPAGPPRPIFGNALGLNPDAAAALAADKDYTARLLAAEGLPAPRGMALFSPAYAARMRLKNAAVAGALPGLAEAEACAAALGYPVVLKPNTGSEGRGVHRPADAAELRADIAALFATDERLRLEERLQGEDIRITVLDGRVRLAYRRQPVSVTGDGRSTLADLARARLAGLATRHRGAKIATQDPRVQRSLAAQGLSLRDVPAPGRAVRLLDSANLSTGGQMEDLTGRLPEAAERLALRAAACLGLRLAGVDLIAPAIAEGIAGARVLEVNSAPGLDYYAAHGPAQYDRARALVMDALSA